MYNIKVWLYPSPRQLCILQIFLNIFRLMSMFNMSSHPEYEWVIGVFTEGSYTSVTICYRFQAFLIIRSKYASLSM